MSENNNNTMSSMLDSLEILAESPDDGKIVLAFGDLPQQLDTWLDDAESTLSEVDTTLGDLTELREDMARAVEAAGDAKADAETQAANAEAWAVGTRGGTDVSTEDETYHNNSKYYAEQTSTGVAAAAASASAAATSAGAAAGSASDAASSANESAVSAAAASASATAASSSQTSAASSATAAAASQAAASTSATSASNSAASASSSATSASGSATAAAASASAAAQSAQDAEDVLDSIPPDYTAMTEDVSALKSAFEHFKNGYDEITGTIIPNEYCDLDGNVQSFNGWSRTDYIPINASEILYYSNTTFSGYNSFYDSDKHFIRRVVTDAGVDLTMTTPDTAAFVIFSNSSAAMASFAIYRKSKSLIDDDVVSETQTWSSSAISTNEKQGILNFDDGKILSSKELVWNTGSINNDGSIDPSVTQYSHTDKIPSEELNGAVLLNVDTNIYGYRYREDGSAIYGYLTLGLGDKLDIPDDTFEDNVDVRLVTGTAYISNIGLLAVTKTKTQTQLDNLKKGASESPNIVMVNKVVALVGEEFDIHYDNILANCRAKDLPYKEVFGSFYGTGMEDMVRIHSNTASSGVSGAIAFGKNINDAFSYATLPSVVLKKSFSVDTIATSVGSGITRKVLLIGDSWTAHGKYARELRSLFESADEPMNITLLGTLGNGGAEVGAQNGYHEGHGGYSSKTFCTKASYNSYNNHFYNPDTQTFDFSYYMNYCGYTSVDDVFINLGINDVAEMQSYEDIVGYWNLMTNSIKAYNSNIRVFIGLCGLPAQYKYGTGQNNNCNRSKARRLMLHRKLIEEYGNRESEGYIIVPLHLSIDSEHDFPTVQRARSHRDATLVDYCTDYVHPNDIAYNKIADRIRTYIKYAETLS